MARIPGSPARSSHLSNPITLLDGNSTPICEPNFLVYKGWEPSTAAKLVKINKGHRLAAVIGLFQRPLTEEIKARDPGNAELNIDRLSRTILQLSYNRYREYQLLNSRSTEIEASLENEYGCKDTFHHLPRRPGTAGIKSKTCICREYKLSKKRKRSKRHQPFLTKLPRHKRKRKREVSQNQGRGLLDFFELLPLVPQHRPHDSRTGSPCPIVGIGGTGDTVLEARDRSLRYKR